MNIWCLQQREDQTEQNSPIPSPVSEKQVVVIVPSDVDQWFHPLVLLFELCISQCFHLVCLHYVTILVACYFYLFCNYPVVVKLFQILVINFSLTLTSALLNYFHLEIWSFFLQET